MSFDAGINFRAGSGFVTDGTSETYDLGASDTTYPTTRGGFTFGWDVATPTTRDRDNTADRRLAGINRNDFGTPKFRLDLPSSGSYNVHLALGDYLFSIGTISAQILDSDGSTVLATISGSTSAGQHFVDATGTERTAWTSTEQPATLTFSGTAMFVKLSGSGDSTPIAHLRVVTAGGGGGGIIPQPYYPLLLGGIGGPF